MFEPDSGLEDVVNNGFMHCQSYLTDLPEGKPPPRALKQYCWKCVSQGCVDLFRRQMVSTDSGELRRKVQRKG